MRWSEREKERDGVRERKREGGGGRERESEEVKQVEMEGHRHISTVLTNSALCAIRGTARLRVSHV
jgi:hypothetical protein